MIIYIAGKMSGLPNYGFSAFNEAAAKLTAQGHSVLNPATTNGGDATHPGGRSWYLREAIRMMLNAEAIVLLDSWEDSRGACLEVTIAQELGMKTFLLLNGKLFEHLVFQSYPSSVLSKAPDTEKQREMEEFSLGKTPSSTRKSCPPVLGLCGFAGSGKDTVFQVMEELRRDVERVAFADALKSEVAQACDITVEELEQNKPRFRKLLQAWGMMRRNQDPNYWIHQVFDKCCVIATEGRTSVITDVRFQNEIDCIRKQGGVLLRVDRKGVGAVNNHVSEHEWTTAQFDYVIQNDGTLEDLENEVKKLLAQWK